MVMVFALAAGCHAELGDATPGGGNNNGVDANTSGIDANNTTGTDAGIDAPACFNGRVVYLNFEGQALTRGTSDATLNRASWMNIASGTAPPFRAGLATRQADIDAITTGVRSQLSSFPVTVVTTRPAAGPYVMIVYGGLRTDVGSDYGLAVNQLDCDESEKSDVAWISGDPQFGIQRIINTSIGAIGFGLGLTATSDPAGCMCGWANNCQSNNNVACTLSNNIDRDPNAQQQCPGVGAKQNERQAFSQAFCQ